MVDIPVFTLDQINDAACMPKRCTEAGTAAAMGLSVSMLQGLRSQNMGPEYSTQVNGTTIYERRHVISWMYRHLKNDNVASMKGVTV